MKEKKMLTITKLDGTVETVEEVISFEFSDTLKKYVVYTKNETDANGNITVYVTEMITDANGANKFVGVESEEEWSKIKDVLRELAK
jgi:uncharacterized protein YrzB (UPF0473 family)